MYAHIVAQPRHSKQCLSRPPATHKDSVMASWYFQSMGEIIGPVTKRQLRQAAIQGKIQSDTLVRSANSTVWVSAHRVSGVFDAKGLAVDSIKMPPGLNEHYLSENSRDGTEESYVPKNREHEEFFISFYRWL